MEYFLFFIYLLLCGWWITTIPFVKNAGISRQSIVLLFLLKIIAGVVIGWVSYHVYGPGNDYWDVNKDGWVEYQLLWSDPHEYFTNLFKSNYGAHYGGIFDSFQSFWNDLRNNLISKMLSVFDLFSRGNYYINSLFFNCMGFLGHVAFYRLFIQVYKNRQKAVIVGCFLLPSMLYFTSGVQKDGIIFIALGLLCYAVYQSLQKSFNTKRLTIIFLCLVTIFLIRSYVLMNLLPALVLWILAVKFKWPPLPTFIAGYIIAGLLFFNIHSIISSINPPQTVVNKQADFFALPQAATMIHTDTLAPHFKSFAVNAPQAYNHLLLRPYPTEISVKNLLPLAVELILYQLLFILFIFNGLKKQEKSYNPFIIFGLFFTLSMFLFIGYIMPNLGSIVRYRSVYLPFLITPLLCRINWVKLQQSINIKK
ncbi:DUF2142 domain-containing protein [Ferruginibacter sp.]